ncbi:MAG: methyl-accepting chemotaxis protein [Xanthobacteraceae bacterium]|nr:MAG: methyl-accepting chemotaxis protein [Xanthobacteraceae bacterium]
MTNWSSLSRSLACSVAATLGAGLGLAGALFDQHELIAAGLGIAAIGSLLTVLANLQARRALGEMGAVCRAIARGDFEARVLGRLERGDLGVMQLALNDMIDRCDAFVREAGASMKAVCDNKYHRRILLEGLHGALRNAAIISNDATEAVRQRVESFDNTATQFEHNVVAIIDSLSDASMTMDRTADTLTGGAGTTRELASAVASASEEATVNMQTVASATAQLTSSASEIADEVHRSTEIARQAVSRVEDTNRTVQGLRKATDHIGEVVKLITAVAEQTNLLALNATIEAARAGDAGRGFAVVAQEVKALAGQTAKATQEISEHIAEVQSTTRSAVEAINGIGAIVSEVAEITDHVARAVGSQTEATTEIARNIEQAFSGMRDITGNVHGVTDNASGTANIASETKQASQTVSTQTESLAHEIRGFLSAMRQGMFDRRRGQDPHYLGPERRVESKPEPKRRTG